MQLYSELHSDKRDEIDSLEWLLVKNLEVPLILLLTGRSTSALLF